MTAIHPQAASAIRAAHIFHNCGPWAAERFIVKNRISRRLFLIAAYLERR